MERTQAFAEYAAILDEALDWIEYGYPREHSRIEPILPRLSRSGNAADIPDSRHRSSPAVSPDTFRGPESEYPATPEIAEPERNAQLDEIASEIAVCRSCDLYLTRKETVPGLGKPPLTLMIVTPPPVDGAGEKDSPLSPSEHEYLGRWLTALGLDPENDCFLTPAVKCRTPGGRPPRPAETLSCTQYLRRQYKAVQPQAVLALGAAACAALTGSPNDFRTLVGKDWNWGAVPALVLWTPAEVLANPGRLRAPVWESLKRLKAAWNALPRNSV